MLLVYLNVTTPTEELRGQLAAAQAELKDTALQHADVLAALRTELRLSQQQAESAVQLHRDSTDELARTRSLLQDALQRVERAEAEAQITRQLINELKRTPPTRTASKQKAG
ncbi:septal ring factor EnvC (AmiA/AmiB activator) [Paraburkholderia youngii]